MIIIVVVVTTEPSSEQKSRPSDGRTDGRGGSRTCQRGRGHGERVERERKRGSAPSGVQGRAPGGSQGAKPPEAESFLFIFIQKSGQKLKVKDLSENLPPCLSRAAITSPKFWSMGGGGAAARTAHSWIRYCDHSLGCTN